MDYSDGSYAAIGHSLSISYISPESASLYARGVIAISFNHTNQIT